MAVDDGTIRQPLVSVDDTPAAHDAAVGTNRQTVTTAVKSAVVIARRHSDQFHGGRVEPGQEFRG